MSSKYNKPVGYFASKGKPESTVQVNWRPESALAITVEIQNYGVQLLCQPMPKSN